eukprot:10123537-Lingulodinium_polyedra.AAC.1
MASAITPVGASPAKAQKRLEAVQSFTGTIKQFARSDADPATTRMAWLLNAKAVARTHDFDARLVPYGTIAD